jgi:ribosome maturation protein SDO1
MVSLEEAVIVKLRTHGENYELYVDADLAVKFRGGENVPIEDVLAVEQVFKDAVKGDKASEEHVKELFQVSDVKEAYKEILLKGELHLTTEQKRKMLADRRKQVASIIARNAVNPQTHAPHPLARIEAAMDEARAEVFLNKSANEQVEKVLKVLKPILPIKFEKAQVALKIPANYTGKLYHVIRELGEVKKEEWAGADQIVLVEIPAGVQDELFAKLNNITRGEVKIKVVKHE